MQEFKTFDEVLAFAGTDQEKEFFSNPELQSQFEPDEIAYRKMKIITRAFNTDPKTKKVWTPDWYDSKEWKYYPWFNMSPDEKDSSGVGFSYDGYDYDFASSDVGSRLCFRTSEAATYAGKQFLDIYKDYFIIRK